MALRTVAQVLADWRDLRDNILPAMEEDGLGSQALETALTLAAPAVASGVGPGTAITQTDILAAINAAQFNTSNNSRYELQLLSDDNGNYYSRFDKQTGTTQALTLAGANYTPVNPRLATPADRELKVSSYVALTTSSGNWVAGEGLERVQVIDTSSTTPQIVSTQWFNGSGILLSSTVPSLSTDVVTASNKFSYSLAQDGTEPIIARTNIATFATSYFKINGSPHTPIRVSHISTNLYTKYDYYVTTTAKSGSWSLGELITSVDTYDGTTNPATFIGSIYLNETGVSLTITGAEFLTFSNVQKVLSSNSAAQTNLLDSIRLESIRKATAASFGFVQTAVAGTNFVPLTTGACTEVMLLNLEPSAVDIEVRRGATGDTVLLPFGTSMLLEAITNSFDIQVRRADTQNTQVLVRFERRTR